MNSVTITAKEKLCFLETPECNPDACPYAKGHFDRVGDAVYEIIHKETGITREVVLRYAKEHRVCPFEFCLDISNWVDSIICDYNYVFDPNIRLKRYFSEGISGEYLFLTDEAHNLVPRAREMYRAAVYKEDFLLIKKVIKPMNPEACPDAGAVQQRTFRNETGMREFSDTGRYPVFHDRHHDSFRGIGKVFGSQ